MIGRAEFMTRLSEHYETFLVYLGEVLERDLGRRFTHEHCRDILHVALLTRGDHAYAPTFPNLANALVGAFDMSKTSTHLRNIMRELATKNTALFHAPSADELTDLLRQRGAGDAVSRVNFMSAEQRRRTWYSLAKNPAAPVAELTGDKT